MTPSEIADHRRGIEALIADGIVTGSVDEIIGDTQPLTYHDTDIRAAFPSLRQSDTLLSVCGNTIMGGATRIHYLSEPADNRVVVKGASCDQIRGGLMCDPLSEQQAYFYRSPEDFFYLEGGAKLAEALEILQTFEAQGIERVPQSFAAESYADVRSISPIAGGYRLVLGEYYCRGCVTTLEVRLEHTEEGESSLILLGDPEGMCI
jgi:hypothetical protein